MKICMVGLEIGPSKEGVFVGGAANSVIRLSHSLWENGNRICIVTTPARYSTGNAYKVPWAEVHSLPVNGVYSSASYGLQYVTKAIFETVSLHKKEEFDIIHGHSGYPVVGLIPRILGRMLRIPSVHTLYCPLGQKTTPENYYQHLSRPFLIKRLFLSVDKIIAISKNVKNSLEKLGLPSHKIEVIPPAIDLSKFSPKVSGEQVRASLGVDLDEPLILFVGNLTKTKGIHVLIKAMKMIVKDFPAVKLLITLHISKDNLDKETCNLRKKIDSLHLKKSTMFMGITRKMPEVIAACDLLVAPFLSTADISDYPLPLLEAMAIGKAVVATKVGGIPEMISNEETGMLIEPSNPIDLADTIAYLLENEAVRRKIGQNSSKFVSGNFSTQKITKMTEGVYKEAIK